MQEKVEQYLLKVEQNEQKLNEKANKAKAEEEKKYKREVLSQAGLIEKEYREKGGKKVDYPLYDEHKYEYYREIIPELTEEEWQAVETAYKKSQELKKKSVAVTASAANTETEKTGNSIAKALKAIAVILYIGAVIGAIAAGAVTKTVLPAVYVLCGGILSGIFAHGFSEIIRLLDCINRNTEKK